MIDYLPSILETKQLSFERLRNLLPSLIMFRNKDFCFNCFVFCLQEVPHAHFAIRRRWILGVLRTERHEPNGTEERKGGTVEDSGLRKTT